MVKEQYIKRHDRVCVQLHFNICKETGVQLDKKHWYEHVPKSVETIPGNHEVKELQKTAKLGTAHILRKVLT
jgi:excinuclease UvrABC nuclease subunit